MRRDPRFWGFLAAAALAVWLILPQLLGGRAPVGGPPPEIDYLCRETGAVFRLPAASPAPAHPHTGRATLVPAVYDPATQRWRPGPPPEVRQRSGAAERR